MRRSLDSNVGLITFGPNKTQDRTSWCPTCAKVGINSPLKHRIYLDERGNITSPESDAKNWRQCWTCGEIIPIYQAQQELIEEDKKVVCIVDKLNPRIHHLFLNDSIKLAMMNLILSRVEKEVKGRGRNVYYTIVPLVGGGFVIGGNDGSFSYQRQSKFTDGVKNIIESASRLKSLL